MALLLFFLSWLFMVANGGETTIFTLTANSELGCGKCDETWEKIKSTKPAPDLIIIAEQEGCNADQNQRLWGCLQNMAGNADIKYVPPKPDSKAVESPKAVEDPKAAKDLEKLEAPEGSAFMAITGKTKFSASQIWASTYQGMLLLVRETKKNLLTNFKQDKISKGSFSTSEKGSINFQFTFNDAHYSVVEAHFPTKGLAPLAEKVPNLEKVVLNPIVPHNLASAPTGADRIEALRRKNGGREEKIREWVEKGWLGKKDTVDIVLGDLNYRLDATDANKMKTRTQWLAQLTNPEKNDELMKDDLFRYSDLIIEHKMNCGTDSHGVKIGLPNLPVTYKRHYTTEEERDACVEYNQHFNAGTSRPDTYMDSASLCLFGKKEADLPVKPQKGFKKSMKNLFVTAKTNMLPVKKDVFAMPVGWLDRICIKAPGYKVHRTDGMVPTRVMGDHLVVYAIFTITSTKAISLKEISLEPVRRGIRREEAFNNKRDKEPI